ncbi:hypothetical protein CR513_08759, partial [Mucuna pruriens]
MDKAKEAIQKNFNGNEDKHKDIFVIIDRRWDCQLRHSLHAVVYFLNPEFFYKNPNIEMNCEVLEGLYKCIDMLNENNEFVDHIHNELPMYERTTNMFGYLAIVRKKTTIIRVLLVTCWDARVIRVPLSIFIQRRDASLSTKSFKTWFMLSITKLFKNAISAMILLMMMF